ncbi:MAG: ATP-dependent helicase, partial [Candidatus Woesearchaeota archaeon]|nr:ATP-dependent helicase [Candidatus Woesearchaeota archaeon]
IKFKDHMKKVEWCIIDEVHALAENKRGVYLSLSMERLQKLSGHMARIGLSATVAPLEEVAQYLVGSKRDCIIVDVQFIKDLDLKVVSPVSDFINVSHEELHQKLYDLIDKMIQKHKTTLIFTNTRSATERVVHHLKEKFPKKYTENIGAHHSSLSKEHRLQIENNLRDGKLKVVVCSTSLELGIDIGFIDLVILLSSPKSVARALQRVGRAGHQLHATAKGRLIVMDRDDLVECSVLLKSGVEKKIDRLHIPCNCLDVLAQQIYGIAISDKTHIDDIFKMIKKSYCYRDLTSKDFMAVIDYLSGKHVSLEDRHIYAKIWYDEETKMIGRKGKMARVIYMTNVGTIPDETSVLVKIGSQTVGMVEEGFLEKLRPGDIFVLGGQVYQFKFARGMVAQVSASANRPPTVPSWFSQMLPLSFDLAMNIGRFRRLLKEKFMAGKTKKEIIDFINEYLYLDKKAALAIYKYFKEQTLFLEIPTDKKIIVEIYNDGKQTFYLFQTLFGRRVNDCLSRAVAFAIHRMQHHDVEIGINDNGFYVTSQKKINVLNAFKILKSEKLALVLKQAIEKSEVLKRRFRHCAGRAFMILRTYKGRTKRVGRQQVSSQILLSAVRRIDENFPILKEARREVLEDLMDIQHTEEILKLIEDGKIKVEERTTSLPSPFAFNLISQGIADILKMEEKQEFLRRMHNSVVAKIALKGKTKEEIEDLDYDKGFSYQKMWDEAAEKKAEDHDEEKHQLKLKVFNLKRTPRYVKSEIIEVIDGLQDGFSERFVTEYERYKKEIKQSWDKEVREFVEKHMD